MRDPALDIRRPDLHGVRRTGAVRWWKSEKGYKSPVSGTCPTCSATSGPAGRS